MSNHFEAQLEGGALVIRVPVKVYVVRREDLPANVLLTRRELEVYELLREHRRDKEIAKLLGITARTVKFHVSAIFSKLGVKNRAEFWLAYGESATHENLANLGEGDCCGGDLGRG